MRTRHKVIAAIAVAAAGVVGTYSAVHTSTPPLLPSKTIAAPLTAAHVAPENVYPNPMLTPGAADTLDPANLTATYSDSCPNGKTSCTYSQDHRNVPAAEHTQVYDEYNVPQSLRNIKNGEVDHFYPLCAGGSNDIENLWYQPAVNDFNGTNYGFHEKDKLEAYICVQIKAGTLSPSDAFRKMTTDWVAWYLELEQTGTLQPASAGTVE